MKNNMLANITKTLVSVCFYIGIVVTVTVPLWGQFFYTYVETPSQFHSLMTFMLIISGACGVYIFYNLKLIFNTLNKNPFVSKNIQYLKNMGVTSLIISAIYIVKLVFLPTLASIIVIIVFLMAGLFCLTVKDLFTKAVNYKQDNDMTI